MVKFPLTMGVLRAIGKCLLGLYILPYGPDEVRLRNLGVRLG